MLIFNKNSLIKLISCLIISYSTHSQAIELSESTADKSSGKEYSLFLNLKQGHFVFAKTKVEAEFNSVLLQRTSYFNQSSTEWFYNLSFDYMFNKSRASCYSVLASLGYKFYLLNTDYLTIKPSIGYGVTLYKEQSNIQNVNSIGNNVFSQASLDYKIDDKKSISLNWQYNYQSHSRSWTAENNADEMVLIYMTYGLGMTWRF